MIIKLTIPEEYKKSILVILEILEEAYPNIKLEEIKEEERYERLNIYESYPYKLHVLTFSLEVNNKQVELSSILFHLMEQLISRKNRTVTYSSLIREVWKTEEDYFSRDSLKRNIGRLRKIVDPNHIYIKNVRGIGYKLITGIKE